MKANKIFIMGAFATAMLCGCSDSFLEVQNPTGEPLEEYYTTDERIQEALNAAYDPLHWPDWGLGQYNALNIDAEILADDFWVGGETPNDMLNWQKLFNYEGDENNTLNSLWTVDYSGVKRCNDVLKYLEWGKDLSDDNKKSYEMQARCLRVYYYNMLWHYFGNIPFYLENLENPPYTAPQYTADEVYNELITELEAIIDSNVLPMRWEDSQSGRTSQAMAWMMYAEMVMYQNDESRYDKALTGMQAIINSGKYELNPDYANLWTEAGEWCSESIFEINYEDGNNERGWSSPLAVGGTVLPTLIAPNTWPGGDGWDKGGDGWGFLPMREETYNMFEEGDVRRDATCWDVRYLLGADDDYKARYLDTHIWLAKYRPFTENNKDAGFDNNLNYNNNYRYYRYAETLLNAAELSLLTGSGNASGYLNKVRNRAGLTDIDATIDNIIEERHLEFVGEGKRYWDLVRSGKAASVLVPDSYGIRTNAWTVNKKHIPIAQAEIDAALGTLVQNEAYFK